MTNEEAKKAEKELNALLNMCNPSPLTKELEDALKMAIQAIEAQPSEDCISREQAKKFLYKEIELLHDDGLYDCFSRIIDDMYDELPSVTPQRTKGKWIEDTQTGFKIRCSECGARNFGADRAYCPRCGRQMKEDNDD